MVDELEVQIQAIQNQLQMKIKEKEMYMLERGVYEKQIDQARSKYVLQINKY